MARRSVATADRMLEHECDEPGDCGSNQSAERPSTALWIRDLNKNLRGQMFIDCRDLSVRSQVTQSALTQSLRFEELQLYT